MKGYLVKSILGLTLTTVVVGGTIYGVHKYNDSKSVATGIEASEEFALNDVRNEEALTDADELELLTLQKAEEDAEVTDEDAVVEETEETTKEDAVAEETEETTKEDAEVTETEEDTDKEEDKKPSTEKKEEVKAEETTSETAQTTSEEPQANIVEEPQAVATEETATTETTEQTQPTEQVSNVPSPDAWKLMLPAYYENPENDAQRLMNDLHTATSEEEFIQKRDELNNSSFDINGNLVDPSMITTEEPTDTVTEVIE